MSLQLVGTYAPNPTNVRARSTKLGASPQGDRILYAQGRTVVIRHIRDERATTLYAQHAQPVTVARMSPSGFYVASADITGKVRVWDITGSEQMLKLEVQALAGRVHDLVWDGESKRILVVGDGREKYAHAFLFDTGSSVGELNGHSKAVNSVAVRSQRPFRAVTGADDCSVMFYTGVPFRYARTLSHHTRFVQDVAYAPNGTTFASAGADGRVFLYDGQTGDMQAELSVASTAHAGTVFAVSYSPDSALMATAGADGAVRIWDIAKRALLSEWRSDERDRVHAQQVGLIWTREALISLSFSGVFVVLEPDTSVQLRGMLRGPTMSVVDLAADGNQIIAAASIDGRVYLYGKQGADRVPKEHAWPSLLRIGCAQRAFVVAALDNTLRLMSSASNADDEIVSLAVSGHPRHMHVCKNHVFVVTDKGIDVVTIGDQDDKACSGTSLQVLVPQATCITSDATAALVAIGSEDARVRLFRYEKASFHFLGELASGRSSITALAFSPDASLLAVGESSGKILVYDIEAQALKLSQWVFHSARIHSLHWSHDGAHVVSASLDTHIYVWSVAQPMQKAVFKNAHAGGTNAALWIDERTIVSAGADGAVREVRTYDYTDHSILGHHCHHPHRCVALSGQIRSITSNDIFLLTPALEGGGWSLCTPRPTTSYIVKKASHNESEVCGVGRQKRRPCLARTGRLNVSTTTRATGSRPKNPTSYFDACCI